MVHSAQDEMDTTVLHSTRLCVRIFDPRFVYTTTNLVFYTDTSCLSEYSSLSLSRVRSYHKSLTVFIVYFSVCIAVTRCKHLLHSTHTMADLYQLSCDQDDLPAVPINHPPGAPGDDVRDSHEDMLLPPPRVNVTDAAADHLERPAPPRSASLPASPRLQESLDNIGCTWLAGDPQGVVAAAAAAALRRGGHSLRRPHIGRAPSAPARPRRSSPPRGCLCFDCRGSALLL